MDRTHCHEDGIIPDRALPARAARGISLEQVIGSRA